MHKLLPAALAVATFFAASRVALTQDTGASDTGALAAAPAAPDEIVPRDWVVIEPVDERGRRPFRPDAVFAAFLLARDSEPPAPGGALSGEIGEQHLWTHREADDAGELGGQEIGWAYTAVPCESARVMLAALSGASTLFVNGEGFVGDVYRAGFGAVPIALHAGRNDVFVTGVRGSFRLVLTAPDAPLLLARSDATLPDLVAGATDEAHADRAGLLFMNASTEALPRLDVMTRMSGSSTAHAAPVPAGLPALGVAKVPVWARSEQRAPADAAGESRTLSVSFSGGADKPPQVEEFTLHVVDAASPRRCVFTSAIDRSVQAFALRPPAATAEAVPRPLRAGGTLFDRPRIVLSLHGAGVDCLAQARAYSAHAGTWIAAPTNRRPFGFDWQDWGRLDAYEVLDEALSVSHADPATLGLTGHSMGGHGTWHLAANDPDRFAAIAPSAGWASFDSYGGRPAGELAATWHAADAASDTLALIDNLAQLPTFILHGTADDNVPVSEAHAMEAALLAAGGAPLVHYQEGVGHWWDGDAASGADCVDWPDLFALLEASRVPGEPTELKWTLVDPVVDSRHHWLSASQPQRYGERMHLTGAWDLLHDQVTVTTRNARRIGIRWPGSKAPDSLLLDEQEFDGDALAAGDRAHAAFRNVDGRWFIQKQGLPLLERRDEETGAAKTPGRSGPFKRAFDRGFVLVYGTAGGPQEDAELLARARYDAEVWWYRANGYAPMVSDSVFLDSLGSDRWARRNVILYGNADTNAAWDAVLDERCPIRATRGKLTLGETSWERDDLGALFVFPRKGEPHTLVGAFADTGPAGSRLGYTLAPFVSGVGYPDYAVFGREVLSAGDGGVLAAGWFDADWTTTQAPAVLR